jgi:hypothetical protein
MARGSRRRLRAARVRLLHLGADEAGSSALLAYWREFGSRYVAALCALPGLGEASTKPTAPSPTPGELDTLAAAVPPVIGAEYLTSPFRGFSSPVTPPGIWSGAYIQPRGKPEGRKNAIRLPCHLHHTVVGAGQGAAHATWHGLAGICRGQESRASAVAAYAGSACCPAMRLVEGDGRRRRNLSSIALALATGAAISEACARHWNAPVSCECPRTGA